MWRKARLKTQEAVAAPIPSKPSLTLRNSGQKLSSSCWRISSGGLLGCPHSFITSDFFFPEEDKFALKALNFVLFAKRKKYFKLNSGTIKQHMFTIPKRKKKIHKSHFILGYHVTVSRATTCLVQLPAFVIVLTLNPIPLPCPLPLKTNLNLLLLLLLLMELNWDWCVFTGLYLSQLPALKIWTRNFGLHWVDEMCETHSWIMWESDTSALVTRWYDQKLEI